MLTEGFTAVDHTLAGEARLLDHCVTTQTRVHDLGHVDGPGMLSNEKYLLRRLQDGLKEPDQRLLKLMFQVVRVVEG